MNESSQKYLFTNPFINMEREDKDKLNGKLDDSGTKSEGRKEVKDRLIELKVDVAKVFKMPIYGRVILPNSSRSTHKRWRNLLIPFMVKFHERNLRRYGG